MSNPRTRATLFSSTDDNWSSGEWATPNEFFRRLNHEFHFTLDACATPNNTKCQRFFTKAQDGLLQDWGKECVFLNPPYGRQIAAWLAKAREATTRGATVVALIHARTDTRWFHQYVWPFADEIRFVKGRLRFAKSGGSSSGAPFPSMVVVFRPNLRVPATLVRKVTGPVVRTENS